MLMEFDYWLSYGKGDCGEGYLEMEITDEEYQRLKKAFLSGEEFYMCEDVEDIYDRAYTIANKDATSELIAEGILEKGKEADDLYPIEVNYPFSDDEFEDEEDEV